MYGITSAQRRKSFLNSFDIVLHSAKNLPLCYLNRLARSLSHLEFIYNTRTTICNIISGITFSNTPIYTSRFHITSR